MGIVVIIHHSSWCLFRSRGGGIISTIVFNLIVVVVQGEGAMHVNTGIFSTIIFNLIVVVLLLLLSFLWASLSSLIIQGTGAMHVNTGIISTIVFNLILIIVTVLSACTLLSSFWCKGGRTNKNIPGSMWFLATRWCLLLENSRWHFITWYLWC